MRIPFGHHPVELLCACLTGSVGRRTHRKLSASLMYRNTTACTSKNWKDMAIAINWLIFVLPEIHLEHAVYEILQMCCTWRCIGLELLIKFYLSGRLCSYAWMNTYRFIFLCMNVCVLFPHAEQPEGGQHTVTKEGNEPGSLLGSAGK